MARKRKPVIPIDDCIEGPLLTKEEEFSLSWEGKTELMLKRVRKRQAIWEKKAKDAALEVAKLQAEIDEYERQLSV